MNPAVFASVFLQCCQDNVVIWLQPMTLFEKVSGLAQIPTPHMQQCSHVAAEEGQQSKSKVLRARPVCQLWATLRSISFTFRSTVMHQVKKEAREQLFLSDNHCRINHLELQVRSRCLGCVASSWLNKHRKFSLFSDYIRLHCVSTSQPGSRFKERLFTDTEAKRATHEIFNTWKCEITQLLLNSKYPNEPNTSLEFHDEF